MEYTDEEEEKNALPYELALEYDNRSYSVYYISLIRTKNNFINTFLYYAINGLFFDDDTMHKIYESKGSLILNIKLLK